MAISVGTTGYISHCRGTAIFGRANLPASLKHLPSGELLWYPAEQVQRPSDPHVAVVRKAVHCSCSSQRSPILSAAAEKRFRLLICQLLMTQICGHISNAENISLNIKTVKMTHENIVTVFHAPVGCGINSCDRLNMTASVV